MTATIYKFPIQHTAGYIYAESEDIPSLADMCLVLHRNRSVLDDVDRSFFALIDRVLASGGEAKFETIIECRSIAWSMMGRYGFA